MKRTVFGVIGHVDHGKTALVHALTGQDTDRLPEEKERGISITLGFAHTRVGDDIEVDLIDMPGHERFVRTMIAGATGIDAVLLVIAANEGVMPQTVEHVDIAMLLGIRSAVVAVTKCDTVPGDTSSAVGREAMRLLHDAGFFATPPITTSARDGRGLDQLRGALASSTALRQARPSDGIPFIPIDRVFSVVGHGPVVTGTLRGGVITAGDTLELLPTGKPVRVKGIEVRGRRMPSADPGQRTALNLSQVEMAELERGMALAAPGMLRPSEWITISIRSLPSASSLKNGARLMAMLGTSHYEVRLRLLDRDVLEAGESGFAQLRFAQGIAIPAREHVILRLPSPAATVAGGVILDPVTERHRRNDTDLVKWLSDLLHSTAANLVVTQVQRAKQRGTSVSRLSQLSALPPARVVQILEGLPSAVTRSGVAVETTVLEELAKQISKHLTSEHHGLSHEALVDMLPDSHEDLVEEAVRRLIASGVAERRGGRLVIPRPEESRLRERRELDLGARIAEALRRAALSPPDVGKLVDSLEAKRAVDRLLRSGVVVRTVDRVQKREFLFHRDAVEDAQRRLRPVLEEMRGLLVSEIGATLGISRKHSIPLVEHLDRIKFTQRVGDRHVAGSASYGVTTLRPSHRDKVPINAKRKR